jgi:hypothetical protein
VAAESLRRREIRFPHAGGGTPNGRRTEPTFCVFSRRCESNMLEFNYRRSGADLQPGRVDKGISFVVRYAAPRSAQLACIEDCEKHCPTKSAALNFCVILRNLGGSPMELLQLIHGQPDAVLDGRDLEEAIDRQRTRPETEAIPPWR